ncbi:hypothetical protein C9374_000409 [Naegleria lovaniensis]|uniref:Uncharacterized protein n=1 Tax=Naegleria lovaniensis TaxID=51637 RepID=A0AA88GWG2_NAELO|nr:uncharacterized protein C9374_000409 [Naegleria lovaniensis]KAG2388245.1 hypothetical protein C9374_000409 [Naegleria lovaniensis]
MAPHQLHKGSRLVVQMLMALIITFISAQAFSSGFYAVVASSQRGCVLNREGDCSAVSDRSSLVLSYDPKNMPHEVSSKEELNARGCGSIQGYYANPLCKEKWYRKLKYRKVVLSQGEAPSSSSSSDSTAPPLKASTTNEASGPSVVETSVISTNSLNRKYSSDSDKSATSRPLVTSLNSVSNTKESQKVETTIKPSRIEKSGTKSSSAKRPSVASLNSVGSSNVSQPSTKKAASSSSGSDRATTKHRPTAAKPKSKGQPLSTNESRNDKKSKVSNQANKTVTTSRTAQSTTSSAVSSQASSSRRLVQSATSASVANGNSTASVIQKKAKHSTTPSMTTTTPAKTTASKKSIKAPVKTTSSQRSKKVQPKSLTAVASPTGSKSSETVKSAQSASTSLVRALSKKSSQTKQDKVAKRSSAQSASVNKASPKKSKPQPSKKAANNSSSITKKSHTTTTTKDNKKSPTMKPKASSKPNASSPVAVSTKTSASSQASQAGSSNAHSTPVNAPVDATQTPIVSNAVSSQSMMTNMISGNDFKPISVNSVSTVAADSSINTESTQTSGNNVVNTPVSTTPTASPSSEAVSSQTPTASPSVPVSTNAPNTAGTTNTAEPLKSNSNEPKTQIEKPRNVPVVGRFYGVKSSGRNNRRPSSSVGTLDLKDLLSQIKRVDKKKKHKPHRRVKKHSSKCTKPAPVSQNPPQSTQMINNIQNIQPSPMFMYPLPQYPDPSRYNDHERSSIRSFLRERFLEYLQNRNQNTLKSSENQVNVVDQIKALIATIPQQHAETGLSAQTISSSAQVDRKALAQAVKRMGTATKNLKKAQTNEDRVLKAVEKAKKALNHAKKNSADKQRFLEKTTTKQTDLVDKMKVEKDIILKLNDYLKKQQK